MSLTFLAKSSAYSWKMSFCGQVDCQRMVIGPCARTIVGKPRAAAPVAVAATAAPLRNLRRASFMEHLLHPLARSAFQMSGTWAAAIVTDRAVKKLRLRG